MKTTPPQTSEWETEPEFEALQACCVKGGADKRALPHYIKAHEARVRREVGKKLLKETDLWEHNFLRDKNPNMCGSDLYTLINYLDSLSKGGSV